MISRLPGQGRSFCAAAVGREAAGTAGGARRVIMTPFRAAISCRGETEEICREEAFVVETQHDRSGRGFLSRDGGAEVDEGLGTGLLPSVHRIAIHDPSSPRTGPACVPRMPSPFPWLPSSAKGGGRLSRPPRPGWSLCQPLPAFPDTRGPQRPGGRMPRSRGARNRSRSVKEFPGSPEVGFMSRPETTGGSPSNKNNGRRGEIQGDFCPCFRYPLMPTSRVRPPGDSESGAPRRGLEVNRSRCP